MSKNVIRDFTEEMNIMARIKHKNIVRCFGGSMSPPKIFIVEVGGHNVEQRCRSEFELIKAGSLQSWRNMFVQTNPS